MAAPFRWGWVLTCNLHKQLFTNTSLCRVCVAEYWEDARRGDDSVPLGLTEFSKAA